MIAIQIYLKWGLNRLAALFVLLIIASQLSAQPFEKAPLVPKKKVRLIIEWVRPDLHAKSQEGMRSEFDRNGHLVAYYDPKQTPSKKTVFQYDKKGRLIEHVEQHDEYEWKAIYAYQKDKIVKEVKFRGKTTKTFSFKNKKGQLIETKTFTKGLELGSDFLLREQVFYYYDQRDSLKSRKIVRFDLIPGKRSKRYESRKILYFYSPKTGKKSKTVEYDFDGTVLKETYFEYDKSKRLNKKLSHFKMENSLYTHSYKYQKGKLWQEISERPGYKDVKIYVDGRLIRLRSYNEDRLVRVVDYQYVYY